MQAHPAKPSVGCRPSERLLGRPLSQAEDATLCRLALSTAHALVLSSPAQAAAHTSGRSFVLPLLIFPLPELPTETLTLPVQEECYRRM